MTRGNFYFWNQYYRGFFIIKTMAELIEYCKTIKSNSSLPMVYKQWVEIIDNDKLILVINPINGISYFCIPRETEIEII